MANEQDPRDIRFEHPSPGWEAEGVEPSEERKAEGYAAGYKPPAGFFNWFWTLVSRCVAELQSKLAGYAEANEGDKAEMRGDLSRHEADKGNPHGVTKAQVGLGSVEDVRQAAKVDFDGHVGNVANPHVVTKAQVGLGSVENIRQAAKTDFDAHAANVANPHVVTKAQVGLGSVPNVATNDQTPTYTAATTLAGLTSGEKLGVAFGKLAKGVTDLIAHLANKSNPHGATAAQVGAPTTAQLTAHTGSTSNPHSVTAAQVGAATTGALSTHTSNVSNPHVVTKAQVGLGSVPNVATNDQTPTYTAAASLANLTSGEKLSVAFGKLARDVAELIAHIGNKSNPHGATAAQVGAPTTAQLTAHTGSTSNPHAVTAAQVGAATTGALNTHTGNVSNPHVVTKAQVGLGSVPNVATNDQVPTYTAATTLAGLTSGEKLSLAFGKLAKGVADLITHLADGVRHITAAERTSWNTVTGKAPTSHASTGTGYGVASAANYGHAMASSTAPKIAGTAAVGGETGKFARGDHVHPAQTSVSGNAGTATKLATGRTVQTNLASSAAATFTGEANITPGVTGVLGGQNGGTARTDGKAPNPGALTLSLNGTSQGAYDGSAAKTVNITPAAIGAATTAALTAHTGSKANPHGVTAAQAGALPIGGGTLTGALTLPYNAGLTWLGLSGSYWPVQIGGSHDMIQLFVNGSATVKNRDNSAFKPMYASNTSQPSSKRYKKDIRDMEEDATDLLDLLRVVTFEYKDSFGDKGRQPGMIAEEVVELDDTFVFWDGEGRPEGINYTKFVPLLIKAYQQQNYRISELEAKLKGEVTQ